MQRNNDDWLNTIAEGVSLTGSVVGSIAAIVFGKLNYGGVVLFLSLWLNLVNRQRLHLIYQQRIRNSIAQLDRSLGEIQTAIGQHVSHVAAEIAELNDTVVETQPTQQLEKLISPIEKSERDLHSLDRSVTQIGSQIETLIQQLRDSLPKETTAETTGSLLTLPNAIAQLSQQMAQLERAIAENKGELAPTPIPVPPVPLVSNVWGVASAEIQPSPPPPPERSQTPPTGFSSWGNPYHADNPGTDTTPQAFPDNQAYTVAPPPQLPPHFQQARAIGPSGELAMAIATETSPQIDLRGAILTGCSLTQANFAGADLTDANLSQADLSGADLREANLMGANLSAANLHEADLDGANLTGADLTRVNLRTTLLRNVYLSGANLAGADLSEFDLSALNLTAANLVSANLSHTNLRDAQLIGANLADADLRDANLERANLTHANFTGANLAGANFGEGENRAQLSGAIAPDGSQYE